MFGMYVPGKRQVISDCLSRAPLSDTEPVGRPEDMIGMKLIEELAWIWKQHAEEIEGDLKHWESSRVVMEYVMKGWPSEREQVDELASEYWSFKEELSVEDGLLFKSDSLVAPRPLRAEVLDEIHGAHMG